MVDKMKILGGVAALNAFAVIAFVACGGVNNLKKSLSRHMRQGGIVYLVGAGPGTKDLLTLKAYELLQEADVIIADGLVHGSILKLIPQNTRLIVMGKRGGKEDSTPQEEINGALVRECQKKKLVVRLQAGDPLVFGRLWPEVEALRAAKCDFRVIPGVTSALSAPAAVNIPITHKEMSRHFGVVSAHKPEELDWGPLSLLDTLVIFMGTRKLKYICDTLMKEGLSHSMDIAIVQWAGRPEERLFLGTLNTIVDVVKDAGPLSPAIIIVGRVAGYAEAHPKWDEIVTWAQLWRC